MDPVLMDVVKPKRLPNKALLEIDRGLDIAPNNLDQPMRKPMTSTIQTAVRPTPLWFSLLLLLLIAVRLYADGMAITTGIVSLLFLVPTAMLLARNSSRESAAIVVLSALFIFVLFSPLPNVGRLLRLFLAGY